MEANPMHTEKNKPSMHAIYVARGAHENF